MCAVLQFARSTYMYMSGFQQYWHAVDKVPVDMVDVPVLDEKSGGTMYKSLGKFKEFNPVKQY